MSAAQLENVNTFMTLGEKVLDFGNQEMIGDEFIFNVPLTEDEASYLVALLRGMLGRFAYDAEYSEHQPSPEGAADPSTSALSP